MLSLTVRVHPSEEQEELLWAIGAAYSQAEMTLLKYVCGRKEPFQLTGQPDWRKTISQQGWGDNWAQSIHNSAQTLHSSSLESAKLHVEELKHHLKYKWAFLAKVKKIKVKKQATVPEIQEWQAWQKHRVHQLQQSIIRLESKLAQKERQLKNNQLKVTLGSKQLFKAQYYLEENGFKSHQEWRLAWEVARNSNFLLVGHKRSTYGNPVAKVMFDQVKSLGLTKSKKNGSQNSEDFIQLRLPPLFRTQNNSKMYSNFTITGIRNQRNLKHLQAALSSTKVLTKKGVGANQSRSPVSVRFYYDSSKGFWYVALSCERLAAPAKKHFDVSEIKAQCSFKGVLGIDSNTDHLASCVINSDGNPRTWKKYPLKLDGTTKQNRTKIGEACAQIVKEAKALDIPLVLEDLDFKAKKRQIMYEAKTQSNAKHHKSLSSFAYQAIIQHLQTGCLEHGVALVKVNPAYSSIIAKANYTVQYGVSVDLASACVIARRAMRFKERTFLAISKSTGLPERYNSVNGEIAPNNSNFWKLLNQKLPKKRHELYGVEVLKRSTALQKASFSLSSQRELAPSQFTYSGDVKSPAALTITASEN